MARQKRQRQRENRRRKPEATVHTPGAKVIARPGARVATFDFVRPLETAATAFTVATETDPETTSGEGTPGPYLVRVALAPPGHVVAPPEVSFNKLWNGADSLIELRADAQRMEIHHVAPTGQSLVFFFTTNKHRRIAKVEVTCDADSFVHAETICLNALLPMLSWLSVTFDAGVEVGAFIVHELNTGSAKAHVVLLGRAQLYWYGSKEIMPPGPEYADAFAAYREGCNATNVFYRALSYHKVIEMVRAMRRRRIRRGKAPEDQSDAERIPSSREALIDIDAWLVDSFDEYLGREFAEVVEALTPLIRDAVAHLTPGKNRLSADRYEDLSACDKANTVLKYVARTMLINEVEAGYHVAEEAADNPKGSTRTRG